MQMIKAREYAATGGLDFAQTVLERAFGMNEAKELSRKNSQFGYMQVRGFGFTLQKADSSQLVNFW